MRYLKSLLTIVILIIFSINLNASEIINIDSKVKVAKNENKFIMIFFHVPYCRYCESMLDNNFKDKKTLTAIKKKFILVDIYTANKATVVFKNFKGTTKEFAKHIGAFAYPATLFLDENGNTIHTAIGYRNLKEYLSEIKYIATKSYGKISLEQFRENLEFNEDE